MSDQHRLSPMAARFDALRRRFQRGPHGTHLPDLSDHLLRDIGFEPPCRLNRDLMRHRIEM